MIAAWQALWQALWQGIWCGVACGLVLGLAFGAGWLYGRLVPGKGWPASTGRSSGTSA